MPLIPKTTSEVIALVIGGIVGVSLILYVMFLNSF